jgi:hypothetical protein
VNSGVEGSVDRCGGGLHPRPSTQRVTRRPRPRPRRTKMQVQRKQDAMELCGLPLIGQERPAPTLRVPRRPNWPQLHPPLVGEAGGRLKGNKNASSTKQDAVEFCGLPLIGQKRPAPTPRVPRRPNGAQLRPPVGMQRRWGVKRIGGCCDTQAGRGPTFAPGGRDGGPSTRSAPSL